MKKFIILLMICLCFYALLQAQDVISQFDDNGLTALNEEIRKIWMRLNNNAGSLKRLIIENRTTDPSDPATGEIWYRTDL
jgi:hypothetical protein